MGGRSARQMVGHPMVLDPYAQQIGMGGLGMGGMMPEYIQQPNFMVTQPYVARYPIDYALLAAHPAIAAALPVATAPAPDDSLFDKYGNPYNDADGPDPGGTG